MTVEDIAKNLSNSYAPSFFMANNNFLVGTGIKNDLPVIYVYLENYKSKEILPEEFEGIKIIVKVIGKVKLL